VTKICSQCGAVLPIGVRACQFCDSSFSVGFSAIEEQSSTPCSREIALLTTEPGLEALIPLAKEATQDNSWRGELAERLKAYRNRRRKPAFSGTQSYFSFQEPPGANGSEPSVTLEEEPVKSQEEFSFTIAVGRSSKAKSEELPMEIDVSLRSDVDSQKQSTAVHVAGDSQTGLYQVSSIEERRIAAIIDLVCLLFAYGGFLGLFGSLGGHFTLSKLSAVVCVTTFAAVYVQYFTLFSIFGGTTPGMMMRGLQVVSFSGEAPTSKQMFLRSLGYLLSAGTFFLGFLWAMWDSDELTWHDRLSRTYLSVEQTLPDLEAPDAARSR
jgi:uncharacterized RDD family membrane protein YckC